MKIKTNDILFKLLFIFPLTTLLQGFPIFSAINRILMCFIIIFLLICIFDYKMSKKNFFVIIALIISYVASFIFTTSYEDGVNNIFYLGIWCILFLYLGDKVEIFKEQFFKNKSFINKILTITTVLLFVSMFLPSSYSNAWGAGKYFHSFSNGEHRLASACIYLISQQIIMFMLSKNKKYLLISFIPALSILMSGARTYLLLLLILYICVYYMLFKNKKIFYFSIIPLLILFFFIVMQTSMAEKFISTLNEGYFDLLGTFTSGRSIFWKGDLIEFSKLPFINQLFGNGYNFVYDVNEKYINARIWAHNDFINIIMTNGYLGLFLYFYTFLSFTNKIIKKYKLDKKFFISFYLIYFFNAMFNMEYTYICSTLSLPVILLLMSIYQKEFVDEKS